MSSLFLFYGLSVLFEPEVSIWIIIFATITSIYGFLVITILIWSWIGGNRKLIQVIKIGSIGYFVLFFMGSLDVGMISGLEFVGLFFLAMCLSLNWYTIKRIVRYKSNA
jgi:Na+/melibiose symporter-like transporter